MDLLTINNQPDLTESASIAGAENKPPDAFVGKIIAMISGIGIGLVFAIVVCAFSPTLNSAIIFTASSIKGLRQSVGKNFNNHEKVKISSPAQKPLFSDPDKPYIVVNTYDNSFELRLQGKILRMGKCSTGSSILLKSPDKREWIFKTPRGRFSILAKVGSPVWHKPDWAFIEDGEPVPPPGSPKRDEEGVLGDYSLHFGNGYMIHGTLYQRFLGLPVTHGCIRLSDEDLKIVYETLDYGSFVFVY
jgi:L,D-transpeptidase YbiS